MSVTARRHRRSRRAALAARMVVAYGLAATFTAFVAVKSFDLMWWAFAA